MSHQISAIEICHFRLLLDPPFRASWDPNPRISHTSTIVRVRAGTYEVTLPDAPDLGVEIDWQHLEPLRIDIETLEA
jgi:L-alanine-DL-glutamate epimerase-like enolase superfamily enzyme